MESRVVIARGWGEAEMGSYLMGIEFQFYGIKSSEDWLHNSMNIVGPLYQQFCICGYNQQWIENIPSPKKIPESSKKRKFNMPHGSNYSHSIYAVLGIISNLEMI